MMAGKLTGLGKLVGEASWESVQCRSRVWKGVLMMVWLGGVMHALIAVRKVEGGIQQFASLFVASLLSRVGNFFFERIMINLLLSPTQLPSLRVITDAF